MTDGPVLELGSGLFSTPLLHWLCAESRRRLLTFEDVREYYDFARQFSSKTHTIHFVRDWDKIDISREWDVVLIDHPVKRRYVDAIRLKDNAKYIILHDTDRHDYRYDEVWPHFKYIYHWKFGMPWTSVVSNYKEIK